MDKIKILVADDHIVLREGTRNLLDREPDMEVVAEASDGFEAVELATELRPDVAIMDILMPRMNGIEAVKQIKEICPDIGILVLSAYDDDQFVFNLLGSGAAGYLLKNIHSEELVTSVRAIYQGESVLHPSIARKVLGHFAPASKGRPCQAAPGTLSERELDFLKLMTRGLGNKEIAAELGVSIRTVQGHLRHIFKKLRVGSRTEAVVRALKEGWVTLDDVPPESPP